jgi:hypothetical protein
MTLPDFLTRDRYGEILLAGHRIGLLHVVELYNEGYDAKGIQGELATLPLPLIEQVLDFYRQNPEEADAYVRETRAEIERQASEPQEGPGMRELRRRFESRNPTGTV